MEGYRYSRRQEVEFRDLDGLGHVNNAVYLSYLESARMGYIREVLGVEEIDAVPVILARTEVDFRAQARYGDVLEVGARISRVGTKSLHMEHEIRAADGRVVIEALAVLVTFDYERNVSVQVPDAVREKLQAYEARSTAPA